MNKRRRRTSWALAAVCLAAFALRLGPLWVNRFHPDEALYASWGLLIRTGRDVVLSQQVADKPPLLFYLMALSFHYVWRCEAAARLPSLLASVVSVPLVFQIARSGGRMTDSSRTDDGLPAAILLALSPYAILFSPTAFLDPLMVTLALAACAAAARGRAGWAGFWLGLSAATKLTGLLFVPLALGLLLTARSVRRPWLAPLARFGLGLAGVLALVGAWDRLKGGVPFWVLQAIHYDGIQLSPLPTWLPRLRAWLAFFPYFFGWPVLLLGLAVCAWIGIMYVFPRANTPVRPYGLLYDPECRPGWANTPVRPYVYPGARGAVRLALLAGFALFYLLVHWLLNFQLWDRYLLGLVAVLALLLGRALTAGAVGIKLWVSGCELWVVSSKWRVSGSKFGRSRLTFDVLCLTLCLLLLPFALTAAGSGYPIGGDHGAYDGIDQVADFLRACPPDTVVYDHWLGWQFKYYLWDAQVYVAYFPDPSVLRDDLRAFGRTSPRYLTIPAYVAAQPVLEAVTQAGFEVRPVLATTNRRAQLTFTVYQIVSQ